MRGQQVLSDPQGWRKLIQARVRPRLEDNDGPGELVESISADCRHVRRVGFTGGLSKLRDAFVRDAVWERVI